MIPVTAGTVAKEQNNPGLEDWNAVPGGSICDRKTGPDASFYASGRRRLKMTWTEDYERKRMSAAQALEAVHSGARVWIQSGCGTPSVLVEALVARAPELRDVEIIHMMTLGSADYTRPEYEGHFRHRGLFLGENVREAVADGRADYTPIFLSEIESLFETGAMPLDVVLMQVSPPDAHGFVSLGTTVDCTLTALRCAPIVIAEVNRQMPRTHGDTVVHVSRISAIVETRPAAAANWQPSRSPRCTCAWRATWPR